MWSKQLRNHSCTDLSKTEFFPASIVNCIKKSFVIFGIKKIASSAIMTGMILLENFKHLSSMTKTIMVVTSTFQVNHLQYAV